MMIAEIGTQFSMGDDFRCQQKSVPVADGGQTNLQIELSFPRNDPLMQAASTWREARSFMTCPVLVIAAGGGVNVG